MAPGEAVGFGYSVAFPDAANEGDARVPDADVGAGKKYRLPKEMVGDARLPSAAVTAADSVAFPEAANVAPGSVPVAEVGVGARVVLPDADRAWSATVPVAKVGLGRKYLVPRAIVGEAREPEAEVGTGSRV